MPNWPLYTLLFAFVLAHNVIRRLIQLRTDKLRAKGASADVKVFSWNPADAGRNIAFYTGGFRALGDTRLNRLVAGYWVSLIGFIATATGLAFYLLPPEPVS